MEVLDLWMVIFFKPGFSYKACNKVPAALVPNTPYRDIFLRSKSPEAFADGLIKGIMELTKLPVDRYPLQSCQIQLLERLNRARAECCALAMIIKSTS